MRNFNFVNQSISHKNSGSWHFGKNFTIKTSETTQLAYFGFLCQRYFGLKSTGILISNCINYGIINGNAGGGVVGANFCCYGTGIIENCINYGPITGLYSAGGIAGTAAAGPDRHDEPEEYDNTLKGQVTFNNCTNNGIILTQDGGGIAGSIAGSGGNISTTSTNRYSNKAFFNN